MYYPRTDGYWPPTRFRLLWIWFFEWRNRRKQNTPKFDTPVVAERRLITEHARGLKRSVQIAEMTTAEQLVAEGHALLEAPQNGGHGVTHGDSNGGTNGADSTADARAGQPR